MFTDLKNWFGKEDCCCNSRLFMLIGPIALIIVLCVILFGCVDCSGNIPTGKYERVKTAAGNNLYKIQIFCPGKTMTFVSTGYWNRSDVRITFRDYITGEDVDTTCPAIQYPILRKRKISSRSEPEEIDELLKNDVVGMMDRAKTPVEQVPVVEETEKKPSNNMQPGSQNSITINNYNK